MHFSLRFQAALHQNLTRSFEKFINGARFMVFIYELRIHYLLKIRLGVKSDFLCLSCIWPFLVLLLVFDFFSGAL